MNQCRRNIMRINNLFFFVIGLFLIFSNSCQDNLLFEFNNPVDPDALNYCGVYTASSPDYIVADDKSDGTLAVFPKLILSECGEAEFYKFQISESSDFSKSYGKLMIAQHTQYTLTSIGNLGRFITGEVPHRIQMEPGASLVIR